VLVAPRLDELVGSSGTRIPDAVPQDSPHHIYSETYNTMTSFHECRDLVKVQGKIVTVHFKGVRRSRRGPGWLILVINQLNAQILVL